MLFFLFFFLIIGTANYNGDLQRYKVANSSRNFLTDWIQVFHGDSIYANVKCVNNIDLFTVEVFGPIKVSLDRPLAKYARLRYVSRSQLSTEESNSLGTPLNTEMAVQSNTNYLQFRWVGFYDVSGIASFEYRVSSQNGSFTDWKNTGLRDVVSVNNTFIDGEWYAAEVCAINMGNLRSDIISSKILVDNSKPELTGIYV